MVEKLINFNHGTIFPGHHAQPAISEDVAGMKQLLKAAIGKSYGSVMPKRIFPLTVSRPMKTITS